MLWWEWLGRFSTSRRCSRKRSANLLPGCFPLCLTSGQRPVELTKENGTTFFIKSQFPTGPKRSIYVSTEFSVTSQWNGTGNENFCKWNTARFGRTRPTGQRGPLPEVVPNIPIRPNRNGPFHLTLTRNFRKIWLNGKHPLFRLCRSSYIVCRICNGWRLRRCM